MSDSEKIEVATDSGKKRKKREKKDLSKVQRRQCRLLRGCDAVTVEFNGVQVKIARSSAIMLVETGKARTNTVLHGDDLRVSLVAIVEKPAEPTPPGA